MKIEFYKYQGTGNDFILIDNRKNNVSLDAKIIEKFCNRRFGIGADGLMFLELDNRADFKMVYFNSDGNQSSMCGNGGRCIVAFAKEIGFISQACTFFAIDGLHEANIQSNIVSLRMNDVTTIDCRQDGSFFLNTGSPHVVQYVENIKDFKVVEEGRKIRYNNEFKANGTNVNFIEKQKDHLFVRTYERGVEDETFSCGTGVTAAGIVASLAEAKEEVKIKTIGGDLKVRFKGNISKGFTDVWLEGPARFVFKGEIDTDDLF